MMRGTGCDLAKNLYLSLILAKYFHGNRVKMVKKKIPLHEPLHECTSYKWCRDLHWYSPGLECFQEGTAMCVCTLLSVRAEFALGALGNA